MTKLKLLLASALLSIPALASAQTAPDAATPAPAATAPAATATASAAPGVGAIWLGGGLEVNTAGSAGVSSLGSSGDMSIDMTSPVALNAVAEYQVTDAIAVGVMPRYVFGFKPTDSQTSDTISMLDLRARVAAGGEVAPQLRLYGFGALGYAIVYPPSNATDQTTASGATFTFGGGANYAFTPTVRAYAELGYEFGLQSISENGASSDVHLSFLELGAGLQVAIGG
jgi:hypothetical protein